MDAVTKWEEPEITVLGSIADLTGEGGYNDDDGWGWSGC
jgi:hypothetical protein